MDLPILTVDTDGMELYDKGEEKAWQELFRVFALKPARLIKSTDVSGTATGITDDDDPAKFI